MAKIERKKNLTLSTTIAIVIVERAIIIWRAKKKTINVHTYKPLTKNEAKRSRATTFAIEKLKW